MDKTLTLLLCFIITSSKISAQVYPKEGAALNYRIIGFSFPQLPEAKEYKIEIAKGTYNKADSFTKNISQTIITKEHRKIAEVPAFGCQYTWRVVYTKKKEKESTSLYHFSTLMNEHVDTNKLHLRILQPAAEQYKDDYVSVDNGGVLYDMRGNPVWFIPDSNGIGGNAIDIQFTSYATITFLHDNNAYEIDYNGNILWKAPNKGVISGDTSSGEFYHHEFTRLSNGHYMVLGIQLLMCKLVSSKDTSFIIISAEKNKQEGYELERFGTLIEYDNNGNVVWSWKSSKYLIGYDFSYYGSGMEAKLRKDPNLRLDPHDNSFFLDEKNKNIYLSYRNLNRIVKIEYPSGKILQTYGQIFRFGIPEIGKGLFCNQHSIRRSIEGYLYFFNNNSCEATDSLPTIVVLREPISLTDTFKKIWEYTCTVEPGAPKTYGSGGNVIELPDHCFFANMGTNYSKVFIVDWGKNILWSAIPEKFSKADEKWTAVHEYKANIISQKDIESLIWNTENAGARLKQ